MKESDRRLIIAYAISSILTFRFYKKVFHSSDIDFSIWLCLHWEFLRIFFSDSVARFLHSPTWNYICSWGWKVFEKIYTYQVSSKKQLTYLIPFTFWFFMTFITFKNPSSALFKTRKPIIFNFQLFAASASSAQG